jgi:Cu(I)/Ag(I) efflux system membrane fusion protein
MKRFPLNERIAAFSLRGAAGVASVAGLIVVGFVLGGLLLGGGESPSSHDEEIHGQAAESAAPTIWTCSMHPQIKLPKPGKCPICFMDWIPLYTGGGSELGPRQIRMSETARQLARIQTTVAAKGYAEAEVRMYGKMIYDETRLAYITAWIPGRLDRLFADYTGITVSKGDHLVNIYSPELLAAQEELLQARSTVSAISTSTSSVLRSTAEATLVASREKLRLYGLTATQIRDIEQTGATSDHLTIHAPIGGVVVHKDATEGMYVDTGTRIYTIADLRNLWAIFEAYESDLPWLRFGQRVEFTSQSFPGERFEGIISFIDPLVDPQKRTVRVRAVVGNKNGRLKPDMFVSGIVKSKIDGEGNIVDDYLAGKWISPMHPEVVKDRPGACDVCGMALVPAASLGYVGDVSATEDATLLIPASAPLITGKRAVVYVEIPDDEGPIFEGREVELGPRAGDFYVVRSGVEEGESVVTRGAFKIDSELQIHAKPSMMSPEGGVAPASHDHGGEVAAGESGSMEGHSEQGALEADDAVQAELAPVYTAYFDIQMALAKDDLETAKSGGAGLSSAVTGVGMSVFSRSGHSRWMGLSRDLGEQAKRLEGSADIDVARDAFYYLSQTVIELHKAFGHSKGGTYYLTHCPMARDGDGAYWLQTVDVVWNSFYGEKMLRCGSIEDTYSPASDNEVD